MKDFTATINPRDPERRAEWLEILGSDTVILRSPHPTMANLPGHPNALVYQLDLDELKPDQRTRLVEYTAARFGYSPDFVEAELDKVGMPILADNIIITIHNPHKWA